MPRPFDSTEVVFLIAALALCYRLGSNVNHADSDRRGLAMKKSRKHARVKSKESAGQSKAQSISAQTGAEGQLSRNEPFPIVGIGASAGGPEAFTQLLKHLPTD